MDEFNGEPYDDDVDDSEAYCIGCGVFLGSRPLTPIRHKPDCQVGLFESGAYDQEDED